MTNKELVTAYYQMWNDKNFDKADLLLDKDIRFRGSVDITANGIDGFKDYAKMLTEAFPNMYHAIEMSVYEGNMAAIYITYSGTHDGEIFNFPATHKRICYSGASFIHIRDSKIVRINILGDLHSLYKQLNQGT